MIPIFYHDIVTPSGHPGDEVISALQKFIRRGRNDLVPRVSAGSYDVMVKNWYCQVSFLRAQPDTGPRQGGGGCSVSALPKSASIGADGLLSQVPRVVGHLLVHGLDGAVDGVEVVVALVNTGS